MCKLTFGIAYTRLPIGTAAVDSDVEVVRNRRMFGPLLWNCRCMFVCGARGSGNETDIGDSDRSPFARPRFVTPFSSAVAMMS